MSADRPSEPSDEIRSVFAALEARFRPGRVTTETTFFFELGSGPGQRWTVRVDAERCEIVEGPPASSADCKIATSPELFLKIVRREHTPGMLDLMTGRIRSNDPFKLSVLGQAFDLGNA